MTINFISDFTFTSAPFGNQWVLELGNMIKCKSIDSKCGETNAKKSPFKLFVQFTVHCSPELSLQ